MENLKGKKIENGRSKVRDRRVWKKITNLFALTLNLIKMYLNIVNEM